MFHVNAWGTVYTALFAGVELIMPQMFLQGGPILTMIRELRPTISLGVPTIWNDVLRVAETTLTSISRACAPSSPAARPCRAS